MFSVTPSLLQVSLFDLKEPEQYQFRIQPTLERNKLLRNPPFTKAHLIQNSRSTQSNGHTPHLPSRLEKEKENIDLDISHF